MNQFEASEIWDQLRHEPELIRQAGSLSDDPLKRQKILRQQYSDSLVRLACELADLRSKAHEKFEQADQLWLTRQSYEQASTLELAAYKAERFARLNPAPDQILDFCTGAGIDAIALSRIAPVISFDLDPLLSKLAAWNAESFPDHHPIQFEQQDVTQVPFAGKVIHFDPDQRDQSGRRHRRLELISPPLEFLQQVSAQARAAAIKLSPASNFGGKFPEAEAELISWRGECKQAVIWSGEFAEPGLWRATVLPANATLAGDPLEAWPDFSGVEQYVYDPDPAITRAGLINLLAAQESVSRLDDAEEYLTSAEPVSSPFMTRFRVLEVFGRNETPLKQYLRTREIGVLEIKCRHLKIDVVRKRKSLLVPGENAATLIFARVSGKTAILVCEREAEG